MHEATRLSPQQGMLREPCLDDGHLDRGGLDKIGVGAKPLAHLIERCEKLLHHGIALGHRHRLVPLNLDLDRRQPVGLKRRPALWGQHHSLPRSPHTDDHLLGRTCR
jgi:hypothetical protein